jgi:hypothetical protein
MQIEDSAADQPVVESTSPK